MTNKLDRDSIRDGHVFRMLQAQQHVTNIRPLTDAERAASLSAFFDTAPGRDVWVFGYGSLIWNPAIHFSEQRTARIWGYHRSFCLRTPLGRGTPENPGLVLALDKGGSCNGIVFKLPEGREKDELSVVWDREMALDSYAAVWVRAMTPDGPVDAVTFVMNRDTERYVGRLPKTAWSNIWRQPRGIWAPAPNIWRTPSLICARPASATGNCSACSGLCAHAWTPPRTVERQYIFRGSWLGRQGSNLRSRDQNPMPYHLATPQGRLQGLYRPCRRDPQAARLNRSFCEYRLPSA